MRLLYFLQFAVWGSYLGCLGQLLGASGLGSYTALFYAMVGVVSLFTPTLAGWLADKTGSPLRMLTVCHTAGATAMALAWFYAAGNQQMELIPFLVRYVTFLAFYMPTVALANATTFKYLHNAGKDARRLFPRIRVWGTIGFIAAMWFVNTAYYHDGAFGFTMDNADPMAIYRFQYTPGMLLVAAILEYLTVIYTLFIKLPAETGTVTTDNADKGNNGQVKKAPLPLFAVFEFLRNRNMALFLIFAMLIGVCLQITNGFATPFITHFRGDEAFAHTWGAANATFILSLSQISEALCMLAVPFFMRRFGFKLTIVTAMTAWGVRYLLFAFGDTGSGLWMIVLSMIVYGVAFDFFNIAAAIFMDRNAPEKLKSAGQGVVMLMANGIGATIGIFIAGGIVNHYCHWLPTQAGPSFMGDWQTPWLIFSIYSFVIAVLFSLLFREKNKKI